jgi:hypothetical protein
MKYALHFVEFIYVNDFVSVRLRSFGAVDNKHLGRESLSAVP